MSKTYAGTITTECVKCGESYEVFRDESLSFEIRVECPFCHFPAKLLPSGEIRPIDRRFVC
uniref:Uncharacterized protein n=1 Tax=viral metagenome TaxID=1070528 RepID=A0A6M3J931_9ZZZZ